MDTKSGTYQDGYQEGYKDGYHDGLAKKGYKDGYHDGLVAGRLSACAKAWFDGYEQSIREDISKKRGKIKKAKKHHSRHRHRKKKGSVKRASSEASSVKGGI